jgi:hypothetical protein
VDAVGEAAARVALVDVVAEVEDDVEILFGQARVRRPETVLEVLAADHTHAQAERVGEAGRRRTRPADRAELAAGAEPVEVVAAGCQTPHVDVDRVGQIRPGERDPGPDHPVEPLVERDLPADRQRPAR